MEEMMLLALLLLKLHLTEDPKQNDQTVFGRIRFRVERLSLMQNIQLLIHTEKTKL